MEEALEDIPEAAENVVRVYFDHLDKTYFEIAQIAGTDAAFVQWCVEKYREEKEKYEQHEWLAPDAELVAAVIYYEKDGEKRISVE